jgi:hypothetical protein
MSSAVLQRSQALWNRTELDLASDEILAQFLERGELSTWRELYRLARDDRALRARVARIVTMVPLPLPHFWLAALASLGEPVDFDAARPEYGGAARI